MVFSTSEYLYPQFTFIATSERPTSGNIRKNLFFSSKPNSGWFPEISGIKRHFRQRCKVCIRFQKRKFNLFLRIGLTPVG